MEKDAKRMTAQRTSSRGLDKRWRTLQDYLVPRLVEHTNYPKITTEAEAEEVALKHVTAWETLGYGYDDFKKIIKKAEDKLKLKEYLWKKITEQKKAEKISSRISGSFLVDKTVDFFTKLLADEARSYDRSTSSTKVNTVSSHRHTSINIDPRRMHTSIDIDSSHRHTSINIDPRTMHTSIDTDSRNKPTSIDTDSRRRHTSIDTGSRRRHTSRSESSASPGPSSNNNDNKSQYEASTTRNNNDKAYGINSQKTSSSSMNEITKGLGGIKRNLLEDPTPPMDYRKRVRLEQEERLKQERVGIEDEMDGLNAYYDTIKEESWDKFTDIIVQMIKLLERSQYKLKQIQNTLKMKSKNQREVDMNRISREVFGDTRKKQNVGQNDMLIYSKLLQRFCAYVSEPELIKDDIAYKPVQDSSWFEKVDVESMETIKELIKKLDDEYENYVREQKIPREYENLFRYLYYDESLKTVQAYVNPYKMISDFVLYLDSVISKEDLAKRIANLRDDQVPMKKVIEDLGELLEIKNLPFNCKSKWGLLLKCLIEFFNHNKICRISNTAKSINMSVDETLPEEYQNHIFNCYVEEALQMSENGELEDFELSFIDAEKLSRAVGETVTFMIDCGFNMHEAIRHYKDGNLYAVLKKLIKPHEVVNPEGNHATLLIRLTYDFIDSTIKKELATLPIPKRYRNLLKRRLVNLISNGQFFQAEALNKVKIKLTVPKMEQETLEPINETDDILNETNPEDLGGIEDGIIPGSAILTKVIVIPPRTKKKFFAYVHGLPIIKKQSSVRMKPLKEVLDHYKVEMATQTVEGLVTMTALVSMQNKSETEVVVLPKGLVIADVEVVDKSAILEEGLFSPAYCSQIIKHFNLREGIKNTQDVEDYLAFPTGNNVIMIPKNQRTDLKVFGTKYVTGKQDYYKVDAVVEFLLANVNKEVETDYPNYLRTAIRKGAQIVRYKDADDLLAYFHGKVGFCPQIDKSFENEKDYTQKFKELEEDNDDLSEEDPNKTVILQLKEFLAFNYEMELPQINEEICFFTEVLEECGHPLRSLPLDFFAVSNYRDIFKEELAFKLDQKLTERRFHSGDLEDFNHLNKISMNSLQSLLKPTQVKDMASFVSFAEQFASEIPSLKEQIDECSSILQGKAVESDCVWTQKTEELFQDMKKQIAGVATLRPPSIEGKMEFFCHASEDCISAVIVQKQKGPNDDEACRYPIAYNSRLLTPEENKMSKIEKQAHAVIWGILFNKNTLSHMDFNLNVTSDQLAKMFKPGNLNTEHWYNKLEDFTFTVKQIKVSENPAAYLTKRKEFGDTRPYARATLVICLFNETLSLLKKNGKARNRWIKLQSKRRKLLKFSDGDDGCGPRGTAQVPGRS